EACSIEPDLTTHIDIVGPGAHQPAGFDKKSAPNSSAEPRSVPPRRRSKASGFFAELRNTAEQLTTLERWYRILSQALKKYLRGRIPPPPRQLKPAGSASYGENGPKRKPALPPTHGFSSSPASGRPALHETVLHRCVSVI